PRSEPSGCIMDRSHATAPGSSAVVVTRLQATTIRTLPFCDIGCMLRSAAIALERRTHSYASPRLPGQLHVFGSQSLRAAHFVPTADGDPSCDLFGVWSQSPSNGTLVPPAPLRCVACDGLVAIAFERRTRSHSDL